MEQPFKAPERPQKPLSGQEYTMTDEEQYEAMLKLLKMDFQLDKNKGNYEIAKYLVEKFHLKTINSREREIYMYDNGVYVSALNFIRKWLHTLLEQECKTHVKNEIIEKIRDISAIERSDFSVDKNLINLNNGVFDIVTWQLLPHDPKYLFLTKIPIDYNPEADCPQVKKFLGQILDSQSIDTVLEYIGFGLYRAYFIKKALILVGERNTGKTTLLRVIHRFFGSENISGVSLQRITSDKFSGAHLFNKHLNTFDDLSFRDINDTGAFKVVTGGGSITGEFKYGNQFQFENYAKLIFACNRIPDVKDNDDEAYFGRWIIIRFNREIEKVDSFLVEKLTTPEEMSGLLNLALHELKKLLEKQTFSNDKEPEEIKAEMMQSGSSIASFASTCLKQTPEEWVSKDQLYEAFQKYALHNKQTILTKVNFGKKIRQHVHYLAEGKKLINGKQVTGWRNVQIVRGDTPPPDQKEDQTISTDSIDFETL